MTVVETIVAGLGIALTAVFGIVLFAYAIGAAAKRADEATEHAWSDEEWPRYPNNPATEMGVNDPVIAQTDPRRDLIAGRIHWIEPGTNGWVIHVTGLDQNIPVTRPYRADQVWLQAIVTEGAIR